LTINKQFYQEVYIIVVKFENQKSKTLINRIEFEFESEMSSTTVSPLNAGDASWMLTSTALVYLMTPGLGFFYGGMADNKNVVNTLYMSFVTMAIVTVQWVLFGYSFSFGTGSSMFGDFSFAGLSFGHGLSNDPNSGVNMDYSPSYPQYIHVMYQCAFAVITPALISGSLIGRVKFTSYCLFVFLWSTICYDGLAHWVWAPTGWLKVLGAQDFAGGTVVHMSSGFSALLAAWYLGPRSTLTNPHHMSSPPFIMLGTGLLWVGWMGFNAGSANAANASAGVALVNTNVAAAAAALTFSFLDAAHTAANPRKHGMTPACIGAVVGLVVITPAAGLVAPGWAIVMGVLGATVCFYACRLKPHTRIDDSLDVFFCHGVGGAVGALLTGFFAEKSYNGMVDGAAFGRGILLWYQLAAVLATIGWCAVCTGAILLFIQHTIGLRASEEHEKHGLDASLHGEMWLSVSVDRYPDGVKVERETVIAKDRESTAPIPATPSSSDNKHRQQQVPPAVAMVTLMTEMVNDTALVSQEITGEASVVTVHPDDTIL